ncbi:MAG: hypothetical protein ACOY41_06660 [Pseudomonadota bacterium]
MRVMLFVCLLAAGGEAVAAEYLSEVESPVYEAPGVPQADILDRARVCIVELATNDEVRDVIVGAGTDSGTIATVSVVPYDHFLVGYRARSYLEVAAKDGRFKVKNTKIESQSMEGMSGRPSAPYGSVGKWSGSGWKKVEAAIGLRVEAIAACIQKPAAEPSKDW